MTRSVCWREQRRVRVSRLKTLACLRVYCENTRRALLRLSCLHPFSHHCESTLKTLACLEANPPPLRKPCFRCAGARGAKSARRGAYRAVQQRQGGPWLGRRLAVHRRPFMLQPEPPTWAPQHITDKRHRIRPSLASCAALATRTSTLPDPVHRFRSRGPPNAPEVSTLAPLDT